MIPKNKPLRLPKLLKAAKDAPCMACGISDGTTVAAHCPDRVAGGGGMGMKSSDHMVAYLCHRCHDIVDGRDMTTTLPKRERVQRWWDAYPKTVAYWLDMEVLK